MHRIVLSLGMPECTRFDISHRYPSKTAYRECNTQTSFLGRLFIDEANDTSAYILPSIDDIRLSRHPLLHIDQVLHLSRHPNVPVSRKIRFCKDHVGFPQRVTFRLWVKYVNGRYGNEVYQAGEEISKPFPVVKHRRHLHNHGIRTM